jgi:predicted GH43/DUF377 family glycosyl hydrolase
MNHIFVHPSRVDFCPDNRRVLVRPFIPSDSERVAHIIERALSLEEAEVESQLRLLQRDFDARHVDLEACWLRNFSSVASGFESDSMSHARKLYIGALFSGEYALESAALFNPSIVPHPDQSGLEANELRFVLSLRATGEGHISSIAFRSGIVHADFSITIDSVSPFVVAPAPTQNPRYRKVIFSHKLHEMGFDNEWARQILSPLGDDFTYEDLRRSLDALPHTNDEAQHEFERTLDCINWLARSNYEAHFPASAKLSQRVIFPVSPNESNGIEDARFVRFLEEDGSPTYYATYTAFNGKAILPQFLETPDFRNFRVCTLNGNAVQNKGMSLFPRRVNGHFAMISRQDDENLWLMFSDNLHFWNDPQLLLGPRQPWEYVKIGNCGSPIETEWGWLLITHGVGPMRRYCMGAMLLDLHDPGRVIGCLREPLVEPTEAFREGYVPNVVYSCGAMAHRGRIILPYAVSDTSSTIGTIDLAELLDALRSSDASVQND